MPITNDELVARQAREIADLKDEIKRRQEAIEDIRLTLHCIGGPLNDNKHGYTRVQLGPFFDIERATDGFKPPCEDC